MSAATQALVLGAGVNGLTCALALQACGVSVRIWSSEAPERTTSRVAAALWYPYRVGPPEAVARWAPLAYAKFCELAKTPGAHGVRMREVIELFPDDPPAPGWRTALEGFRPAREAELCGPLRSGWVYRTPVIDMGHYLEFLQSKLAPKVEIRTCASLDEALARCPNVVNTTGLGARELCSDAAVYPVRGQLLHVDAELPAATLDEHRGAAVRYVVPLERGTVLGGSVEPERLHLDPDPEQSAAILHDCEQLVPALASAQVLETRVGLRPCRDAVRLELEERDGGRLVHNYGHGGGGVTLSWGCAHDVVAALGHRLPAAPWAH